MFDNVGRCPRGLISQSLYGNRREKSQLLLTGNSQEYSKSRKNLLLTKVFAYTITIPVFAQKKNPLSVL